jgi:hypothetical protein
VEGSRIASEEELGESISHVPLMNALLALAQFANSVGQAGTDLAPFVFRGLTCRGKRSGEAGDDARCKDHSSTHCSILQI